MSRKVVIVTGASRGMGRATSQILAEMGANVTLTARSAAALRELADTMNKT